MEMEKVCVLCNYEICSVKKDVDIAVLGSADVKALCKLLQLPQFPFEGQLMKARFCYECKAIVREATQIYEKTAKQASKLTTIREKLQNKLAIFSSNVESTTLLNDDVKDSQMVTGSSIRLDIFRKQICQHLMTISQTGLDTTGTSSCQMICTSTQTCMTPGFHDVKSDQEVRPNIARGDKETQIAADAHNDPCNSKMDVLPEDNTSNSTTISQTGLDTTGTSSCQMIYTSTQTCMTPGFDDVKNDEKMNVLQEDTNSTSTIVSADSSNPSTSKCIRNKSVFSCSHSLETSNRSPLIVELNSTETSEDLDQSMSTDDCDEDVAADATKGYRKGVLDSGPVKPKSSDAEANGPNTAFVTSLELSFIDGENINICETIDVNTSVTPVLDISVSTFQPETDSSYANSEDETDDQIGENKVAEHNLGSASETAVNCEIPPMQAMNDARPASVEASPPVSSSKPVVSMIPKLFPKQMPMLLLEKLPGGKMKAGQSSLVSKPDVGSIKTVMSQIDRPKYMTSVIEPTQPTLSQGNLQRSEGTSVVQPVFNEDEITIINEGSNSAIQYQTLTKNQEQPKKNFSQSEINGNLQPVAPALTTANQNKSPALENANQSTSGNEQTIISLQSEINGNLQPVAPALTTANQNKSPALENANQSTSGNEQTMISLQSEMNQNQHQTLLVRPGCSKNINASQSEMNHHQNPIRKRGRPKMINSSQSEMNHPQNPIRKRGRPKKINSSQSEMINHSTPDAPTPPKKSKSTPVAAKTAKKTNPTPGAPPPPKKTKSTPVVPTPSKKTCSTPVTPKSPKKNKSTSVSPTPAKKTKMSSALKTESRSPSEGKSTTKINGTSSWGRTLKKKETV